AATDEFGSSLVPGKDPNNMYRSGYYNPGYRGHNAYGNVNLVRGDKSATTIKYLKGKIGIILLAGTIPEVVIPDPVKVKSKKFVGRTVELEVDSVTEANGQYSVSLTVKKLVTGPNDQNDYNWTNNIWQRLELVDDKGNRYRSYGPNTFNNNGNHTVQLVVPFGQDGRGGRAPAKLGPPVKLVFNEWSSVTH